MLKSSTFALIFIYLFVLGCTPQPTEEQVSIEENVRAVLSLSVSSDQTKLYIINKADFFTLNITNTGKLQASGLLIDKNQFDNKKIKFLDDAYPGTGGTCASILKQGETCSLVFELFSSTSGSFKDSFSATYNNGFDTITSTESISFNFITGDPAELTFENSEYDFDLLDIAEVKQYVLTVTNSGDFQAKDIATNFLVQTTEQVGVFDFLGGSYPGTGGTCQTTLEPKASCSVVLRADAEDIHLEQDIANSIEFEFASPENIEKSKYGLKVHPIDRRAVLKPVVPSISYDNIMNDPNEIITNDTFDINYTNIGYEKATNIIAITPPQLPIVLDMANSTCLGGAEILVGDTCNVRYIIDPQYGAVTFPQTLSELIIIQYNDQKIPNKTNDEFVASMTIKEEAHLQFHKLTATGPQLTDSELLPLNDWKIVIGDTPKSTNFIIKNGGVPNARFDAENITYEITPVKDWRKDGLPDETFSNDGRLSLLCGGSPCGATLSSYNSKDMKVTYSPQTVPGYNSEYEGKLDWLITVKYWSGRRNKEFKFNLNSEAFDVALLDVTHDFQKALVPTPSSSCDTSGEFTCTFDLDGILKGMTTAPIKFTIQNKGVTPYTINDVTAFIQTPATAVYYNVVGPNTCNGATLVKNGAMDTCDFSVEFTKATYANEGTTDLDPDFQPLLIQFTNGRGPTEEFYQIVNWTMNGKVISRGFFDVTTPGQKIDFGNIGRSVPSDPGLKEYNFEFMMKKTGDWHVTHFVSQFTGASPSFLSEVSKMTTTFSKEFLNKNEAYSVKVSFTAPTTTLNVNEDTFLEIQYHGSNELDTDPYLPTDKIVIPVIANVTDEPDLRFETAIPIVFQSVLFGTWSPYEELLIDNMGQRGVDLPKNAELTWSKDEFEVTMSDQSGCTIHTQSQALRKIEFDIAPGGQCKLTMRTTPPNYGQNQDTLRIDYVDSDDTAYQTSFDMSINGLNYAKLEFDSPHKTTANLIELPNYKIFTENEYDISLSNTQQNSVSGRIIDIQALPYDGSTCNPPTIDKDGSIEDHDPAYENVNKADLKLSIDTSDPFHCLTENTDGVGLATLLENGNPASYCNVKVKTNPVKVEKMTGFCLQVEYRRYIIPTVDSVPDKTIIGVRTKGLLLDSQFEGWENIIAEGPTTHISNPSNEDPAFIKINWNSATSENHAVVYGYDIYRRSHTAPYPATPIVELRGGIYDNEFNSTSRKFSWTDDGQILPLTAGNVYHYLIKPIAKIDDNPGEFITPNLSVDKEIRVIVPYDNMILLHRRTVNLNFCRDVHGVGYSTLRNSPYYNCTYSGSESVNGKFDLEFDRLIDRYESGQFFEFTVNEGGTIPIIYRDIEDAKAYCATRVYNNQDLSLNGLTGRILNSMDYHIASKDIQNNAGGCIINQSQLSESGRSGGQFCKSYYGAEDMIGNAWEFLSDSVRMSAPIGNPIAIWRMDSGPFQGNNLPMGESYFLDDENITGVESFYDLLRYDDFGTRCISEITGFPVNGSNGLCPDGTSKISDVYGSFGYSSNILEAQFAVFHSRWDDLDYRTVVSAEYRTVLAGGSYNSLETDGSGDPKNFKLAPNRYTRLMVTVDEESMTIEDSVVSGFADSTSKIKGAARCVVEVPY